MLKYKIVFILIITGVNFFIGLTIYEYIILKLKHLSGTKNEVIYYKFLKRNLNIFFNVYIKFTSFLRDI